MKKAALVLSGGGARGIAHIGVIEELEQQGFTISSVAGTSMGAMVGGVYALGKMEEFKQWMLSVDKKLVFKMVDFSFSTQGLVKGDKVLKTMREFISDANIEDLSIPYTATACDLLNEKEVVFRTGSIYNAIRASIAIPVVFTPVSSNKHILVDGGVVNNIPVNNVARTEGDTLIVVDVNAHIPPKTLELSKKQSLEKESIYRKKIEAFQSHLKKRYPVERKEHLSYFNILDKTIGLMMYQMAQQSLKNYSPDLLISISRETCGTYDFFKAEELIELGRITVREIFAKGIRN